MITDLKINDNHNPKYYKPYDNPPIPKQLPKLERVRRSDIKPGQIVVVLEGEHARSRVVFVKQLDGFKALCCGPASINNVPFFTIDERLLLRTSTLLKADLKNNITEKDLESETSEMRALNMKLSEEISSTKLMSKYMKTPFSIPQGIDFQSLNF